MSDLKIEDIETIIHDEWIELLPAEKAARKLSNAGVSVKEMLSKEKEKGGTCLLDYEWSSTVYALNNLEYMCDTMDQKAKEISEKVKKT